MGRIAIPPRGGLLRRLRLDEENTRPGQWYFGLPPLALALELRNPTPMAEISPGEYSRPEQAAAIIQGIEKAMVPVIVLRPQMYLSSLRSHLPNHLQPFRDNLYRNYHKTTNFASGDEIWERVDKQAFNR